MFIGIHRYLETIVIFGLAYCQRLDRTHLKYRGILLAATAVDGNGCLFPVAHAIADQENDKNWLWLLQILHCIIPVNTPNLMNTGSLVLRSDRQRQSDQSEVSISKIYVNPKRCSHICFDLTMAVTEIGSLGGRDPQVDEIVPVINPTGNTMSCHTISAAVPLARP